MSELFSAREANQQSVAEFVAAARGVDSPAWGREPAPGRWSPAQVAEHVALAYEATRRILHGPRSGGVPRFLRPLIRHFYVQPILRSGRFPANARAPKQFRPSGSPGATEAVCTRLEAAARGIEADFEQLAAEGKATLEHPVFGRVGLSDALRFLALHTAHHRRQLPAP